MKRRILVIGCGLIGTSLALALSRHKDEFELDGADMSENHIRLARNHGAFHHLFQIEELPDTKYDIIVLATPVRAACAMLNLALTQASIVFDVCSVKKSICETARASENWDRFVPCHPMAGKAEEGPAAATESLFENRPWLYIKGWPAISEVLPVIHKIGAIPIGLNSPDEHDEAMALVSHGIHIASLCAMSTYGRSEQKSGSTHHHLTGPAFADITRLAASPTAFWVETLIENRKAILKYLDEMADVLKDFHVALESKDETRLANLLGEAKEYREEWRGGKEE